jgi:hypothetical protein
MSQRDANHRSHFSVADLPAGPQFDLSCLFGLTFLVAAFAGAAAGSFWAFCLGMVGLMFFLAKAMVHDPAWWMCVAETDSESEARQTGERLQARGFRVSVVDRIELSTDTPRKPWLVAVPWREVRAALEIVHGDLTENVLWPAFVHPRRVHVLESAELADDVASWLKARGVPAQSMDAGDAANACGNGSKCDPDRRFEVWVDDPRDVAMAFYLMLQPSADASDERLESGQPSTDRDLR